MTSKQIKLFIKHLFTKKVLRVGKLAFTIIELLISIAIISLLTTVSLTYYRNGEKSKRVSIAEDSVMTSLRSAQSYVQSGKSTNNPNPQCTKAQYYYMTFVPNS